MKRLKIGIDIDGVIVDYITAALPLFSEVCNRPVSYQDFYCRDLGEALNIDEKKVEYIWEQMLRTDLLRHAPPIKGAIAGLSRVGRHEVWLVTGRPASMKSLTMSWLNGNNIKYDRIVFDSNKTVGKMAVEQDCDVFVEDQLEVASVLAETGVFTILLDQPWNQAPILPKNCIRVSDWNTIVLLINRLEEEQPM